MKTAVVHFVVLAIIAISSSAKAQNEKQLSFAELKATWNAGLNVDYQKLDGTWKRVALAEAKGCENVMSGDATDYSGIKNEDGSVFQLLFSSDHKVQLLNVGEKGRTQGPYEIKEQVLRFSTWAYDVSSGQRIQTDRAYGEYTCREVLNNPAQLI